MASLVSLTQTIIIFLICTVTTMDGKKSKYSKDANKKDYPANSKIDISKRMESNNPFRMQKFNIFWEKVKVAKHLEGDQKAQLFVELSNHDQGEIELKHLKGDGGDADGELEAKLRHSFIDIMRRFDLRNYLTPELKTQFAKSEEKNHFDQKLKTDKHEQNKKLKSRATTADKEKVASLVKQAKDSNDFDSDEIRDLEVELGHFTERKEERDLLIGNDDDEWKHDKMDKKNQMGNKAKLEANIHSQLTDRKFGDKLAGFHHPRVVKLWETAQQSNFTSDELIELGEELQHFEVKLMKHETVNEQASIIKNEASEGDHNLRLVEDKRDEMARGIKKMEHYLHEKISASKMEL